jgi:hypothetical protein
LMPSEVDPPGRDEADRFMKAVMVRNALEHLGQDAFAHIDPVSINVLERNGLIQSKGREAGAERLLKLLDPAAGPMRLAAPPGPLVYLSEDEDHRTVLDVADLLAADRPELRMVAIQHFQGLPPDCMSGRAWRVLSASAASLAPGDRAQWEPAAANLFETLHDDLPLAMSGMRQALAMDYDDGVERYMADCLRPTVESLSSLDFRIWEPTAERDQLNQAIREFADEAGSLAEALDSFYRHLGHLPLSGATGAGALLRHWLARSPGTQPWGELWGWADRHPSPVPRYHACVALLSAPEYVPDGLEAVLWSEVADLCDVAHEPEQQSRWSEAWLLREAVARHYANRLECLLPGQSGERLAVAAWWLTERFAESFAPSPGNLRRLRETTVSPEAESSSLMRQVAHPPIGRSTLMFLTRSTRVTWPTAVLCEAGRTGAKMLTAALSAREWPRIERCLTRLLIQAYPLAGSPPGTSAFAHDCPLRDVVDPWIGALVETPPASEKLRSLLDVAMAVTDPEQLDRTLTMVVAGQPGEQITASLAIRSLAYCVSDSGMRVWELLKDGTRWKALAESAEPNSVLLLSEALSEFQSQHGGEWTSHLPQMYAAAAEEAPSGERETTLFALVLFLSIQTGTVGAIERLMCGGKRAAFADYCARWKDRFVNALPALLPWPAGKVRSALPSLTPD